MDPASPEGAFGPEPRAETFGVHFDPFSSPAPTGGVHHDPFSSPAPTGGAHVDPSSSPAPTSGVHFDPFSSPAPTSGAHHDPFSTPAEPTRGTSPIASGSVAPPGWSPSQPPVVAAVSASAGAVALASPAPVFGAIARSTPADAAIRWRLRAARIDNLIVYGGYTLLCLVLRWNPFSLSHVLLGFVLSVAFHFAFEANGGQTPGKRRVGVQVVSADGSPADAKAIAIRSVLRLIDQLPVAYASGLVSMIRTGPQRRQRIGDVAAGTIVVAVDGRAAARGTPSWFLPTATVLAVVLSAGFAYKVSQAGTQPLSSEQRAEFIAGCQTDASTAECTCLLQQLQADGYDSLNSLNALMAQGQASLLDGRPSEMPAALTTAVRVCRTG